MRGVLRTSGEKRWMEGDTKEKMCHVPPSPLTQRLGSVLTLVPRSGSEHQLLVGHEFSRRLHFIALVKPPSQ